MLMIWKSFRSQDDKITTHLVGHVLLSLNFGANCGLPSTEDCHIDEVWNHKQCSFYLSFRVQENQGNVDLMFEMYASWKSATAWCNIDLEIMHALFLTWLAFNVNHTDVGKIRTIKSRKAVPIMPNPCRNANVLQHLHTVMTVCNK